ncbi:hypothetical protein EVAR_101315_1 [Eumeta japonica]|uniref:Uncharacterized protein n=1 Tax=Eumeta variegata TaxID=151549 RepID=A0A4C1T1V6_EUMVA|nr:hypothetical protein EVAR_101315_1 [Eumeta japonica]
MNVTECWAVCNTKNSNLNDYYRRVEDSLLNLNDYYDDAGCGPVAADDAGDDDVQPLLTVLYDCQLTKLTADELLPK